METKSIPCQQCKGLWPECGCSGLCTCTASGDRCRYSMGMDNKRLDAARRMMKTSRQYREGKFGNGTKKGWSEVLGYIHDNAGFDFFKIVDEAKSKLSDADMIPLVGLQDTTDLRVEMERHFKHYFGKTHLAVALAEMGFRVVFDTPDYFSSDFRSKSFRKALRTTRGVVHPWAN